MALNPKQKKKLRIGIIIASIVTLLIATPIAAFYAMLYDSRAKDTKVDDEDRYLRIFADEITHSFDNLNADNTISLQFSEEKINQTLKVIKTRSYEFGRYVTNVEYNFDNKEFYIDIQIPLFKTRLIASVNPYYDEVEKDLVIEVKNLRAGRVDSMMGLATKLIDNENILKALLWMLDAMSLNVNFDRQNMAFRYPIENIVYDLYSISLSDQSSLIAGLMSQIVQDNESNVSLENKTFAAKFGDYGVNKYELPGFNYSWPIEKNINKYIRPMIQNGVFECINNHEQLKTLRYLLLGYQNITLEEQNSLKELNLAPYGFEDVSTYESESQERLTQKLDLSDLIVAKINNEIETNGNKFTKGYSFNIKVNENEMARAFYDAPMLFNGYCPSSLNGEDIHYLVNDSVYFNFLDGSFAIVNNFNIDNNNLAHSGFFSLKEKKDHIFSFSMDETMFGDKPACPQSDWSYALLLSSRIYQSDGWLRLDIINKDGLHKTKKENYTLVFDFNVPIQESKLRKTLEEKDLTFETALSFTDEDMVLTVTM